MTEENRDLADRPADPKGGLGTTSSVLRRQILGDDVLLTVKEVASLVGVSTRQIYAMIHRRTFPFPKKLGALSRWRLGTVKEWVRAGTPRC